MNVRSVFVSLALHIYISVEHTNYFFIGWFSSVSMSSVPRMSQNQNQWVCLFHLQGQLSVRSNSFWEVWTTQTDPHVEITDSNSNFDSVMKPKLRMVYVLNVSSDLWNLNFSFHERLFGCFFFWLLFQFKYFKNLLHL